MTQLSQAKFGAEQPGEWFHLLKSACFILGGLAALSFVMMG